MGVQGLWSLLQPCARPIKLETLEGKRLAIDSSIWLYHFRMAMRDKEGKTLHNAHVLGFFWRILKLLYYGIRPVFVFDGGAPVMKRQTLIKRRQRREGARDTHKQTAQRLLNARMRQAALEQVMNKGGGAAGGSKASTSRAAAAAAPDMEGAMYMDDIADADAAATGATSAGPSRQTNSTSPEKGKKRDWHKDPYALPALDSDLSKMNATNSTAATRTARGQRTDMRFATEGEIRAVLSSLQPSDVDFDSELFRTLPAELQYELVGDMRAASRGTSYKRLQAMLAASPTPIDFSRAQIAGLKTRNDLTQKTFEVSDSIGDAAIKIPIRVAGSRNREYMIVRNPGVEGGFTLGVKETGTSADKAIDVDKQDEQAWSDIEKEDEVDEEDEDAMEMEEVELPSTSRRSASPGMLAALAEVNAYDPDARRAAAEALVKRRMKEHASQVARERGIRDDGAELEEQLLRARAGGKARQLFKPRGAAAQASTSATRDEELDEWEDDAMAVDSLDEDEEEDLARALELSRSEAQSGAGASTSASAAARYALPEDDDDMELEDVVGGGDQAEELQDFEADQYAALYARLNPAPASSPRVASPSPPPSPPRQRAQPVRSLMEMALEAPVPNASPSPPPEPARATVGGPALGFRLQDRAGEPGRLDPKLLKRRVRTPEPPVRSAPRIEEALLLDERDDEEVEVQRKPTGKETTRMQELAKLVGRYSSGSSSAAKGQKQQQQQQQQASSSSSVAATRGAHTAMPPPPVKSSAPMPPKSRSPEVSKQATLIDLIEDNLTEDQLAEIDAPSRSSSPVAAAAASAAKSPSPPESEPEVERMSKVAATEHQAAVAAGTGVNDELAEVVGNKAASSPVAGARSASASLLAEEKRKSATAHEASPAPSSAREASLPPLDEAPSPPGEAMRQASEEPVLTALDFLPATRKSASLTPPLLDNIPSAVDEAPQLDAAPPLFRNTSPEGTPIEWSPSPSPAPAPLGADGFPLPTLEELEALEAEDEEELGQVAGGAVASFLSRARNQGLYEAQQEAQAEVDKLRVEAAQTRKSEEDITATMVREIQHMLRCFGIPYLTAPMEAEAQCAELVSQRLVDGIITDDSDVFLFGGTRVYKNMFADKKVVECFLLTDMQRELGIDREKLVQLAFLLGSDYTEGLTGVGPVLAMEILGLFPQQDGLARFREWWLKVQAGRDTPEDTRGKTMRRIKKTLAEKVHLDEHWPDPAVVDAYYDATVDSSDEPFQWGSPDLDAIRIILNEYLSWTQDKVDQYLLPIIEAQNRRSRARGLNQSMLDHGNFFDTTAGTGVYAGRKKPKFGSNRLQRVVEGFRGARKAQQGAAGATAAKVSKQKSKGKGKAKAKAPAARKRTADVEASSDGSSQEDFDVQAEAQGPAVPEELVGKEMGKRRPIVRREQRKDADENDDAEELDANIEALEGARPTKTAARPKPRARAARGGAAGAKRGGKRKAAEVDEDAEEEEAEAGPSKPIKKKRSNKRQAAVQDSDDSPLSDALDSGEEQVTARGTASRPAAAKKVASASTTAAAKRGRGGAAKRGGRGSSRVAPGGTSIQAGRSMNLDEVHNLPPSRAQSSTTPSMSRDNSSMALHIDISDDEESD